MWLPDQAKLIKVRLHNQGDDVETAWAEDLGAVATGAPVRRVRVGNVPFLHAKPTYGDVIEVQPDDADGMLEWDRQGVEFEHIGSRIHQDGGRWAMIIDYQGTRPGVDLDATFKALDISAEEVDIALEGAFVRKQERGGRAYLAVPRSKTVADVLVWLRSTEVDLDFTLVHPVKDG